MFTTRMAENLDNVTGRYNLLMAALMLRVGS